MKIFTFNESECKKIRYKMVLIMIRNIFLASLVITFKYSCLALNKKIEKKYNYNK